MNRCGPSNSRIIIFLRAPLSKIQILLMILLFFYPHATNAQDQKIKLISTYDELLITIYMDNGFNFETEVLISDSNVLYLNVEDIFNKLKITCLPKKNRLVGFIENEDNLYIIDFEKKKINIGGQFFSIAKELLEKFGVKYIAASTVSQAFGLSVLFNPRSLSAKLSSNFELPFLKQLRIENTRNTISKLQGKPSIADTIIPRDYHLFKFGTLDWALNSVQTSNKTNSNAVSLGVGTELLFGEANVSVNYNDQIKFDQRQLQYNWRWINNDKKIITQVQLGTIFSQSISQLNAPLIGATINNSPNTIRKASGYFTINDATEPNWTIELYINDILVDYTLADAAGLYAFKVPIVYGYTTLKLKFYGLLGEERTEERTMNTPYTFVPAKTIEYSVTSGIVQDGINSRFAQIGFNYGINRFLTIGGGLEYLSSIPDRPYIPFAKLAIQPFSKMVFNLEYAHNVRLEGLMNFYITESAFLEVNYSKFKKGQLARRFNALEELKVRFSMPFKAKLFSGFTKFNFNQFIYSSFIYNQFDFTFSGYYKQFNINSSSFINWVGANSSQINSILGLSYRLNSGLVVRPSVGYNLKTNKLVRFSSEIEKRVLKMYFSVSYERNFQFKNDNFFVSFKYDLPFSRVALSSSSSNNNLMFSENAQGSLAFGGGNKHVHTGSNSAVGKGGILFHPFLDLNQNGKLDTGEKKVLLSSVGVSGGVAEISKKDSIVRISDLNAFVNYNIEFSNTDLNYISWRFKRNTYQVLVDPNQYKKILVPIVSLGEVSGTVFLSSAEKLKGQGRVTVVIYNEKKQKVGETLSEFDGYFSYLGLQPGKYTVEVDAAQMKKLNYQVTPVLQPITIKVSEEGDIVEELDFILKLIQPKNATVLNTNTSQKDTPINRKPEKILIFTIQIAALKKENKQLEALKNINIYREDSLVKYRFEKFKTYKEAKDRRKQLIKKHKGAFVQALLDHVPIPITMALAQKKLNTN